jgi:hypothetical protein
MRWLQHDAGFDMHQCEHHTDTPITRQPYDVLLLMSMGLCCAASTLSLDVAIKAASNNAEPSSRNLPVIRHRK